MMITDIDVIRDLIHDGSLIWRQSGSVIEKRCPTCKARGRQAWHLLEDFSPDDDQAGGLAGMCKACLHENWQKWRESTGFDANAYQKETRNDSHRVNEQSYYARKVAAGWRRVKNKWIKDSG